MNSLFIGGFFENKKYKEIKVDIDKSIKVLVALDELKSPVNGIGCTIPPIWFISPRVEIVFWTKNLNSSPKYKYEINHAANKEKIEIINDLFLLDKNK